MTLAEQLSNRIRAEYTSRGDHLGWRLLYSPAQTLERADVAFIGLNPGGAREEAEHSIFAVPEGTSAYLAESWKGMPAGAEPLQLQVQMLFGYLGAPAASVLAGNLVPFRSPSWSELRDRRRAITFGKEIWREILVHTKPRVVISMGQITNEAVAELLEIQGLQAVEVGWGRVTAVKGRTKEIMFVGLPHLSRYRIFGRSRSMAAVDQLLSE